MFKRVLIPTLFLAALTTSVMCCAGPKKMHVIGATALLTETESGLTFKSRIDTGATTCSIHARDMKIEGDGKMKVGNFVKFTTVNAKGESVKMRKKIVKITRIKGSEGSDRRLKVWMTLKWKNFSKKVIVNLNNRKKMTYKLLIGRNFLRGDFLVDVSKDTDGE